MNLRRWIGLSQQQRQALHDLAVADVRRSTATTATVEQRPGKALEEAGVDQDPSPVRVDAIYEAAERLFRVHGWT